MRLILIIIFFFQIIFKVSSATLFQDTILKNRTDTFFLYDNPDSNFNMDCKIFEDIGDKNKKKYFELNILFKRSKSQRNFCFEVHSDSILFRCNGKLEFVSKINENVKFIYPYEECIRVFGNSVETSSLIFLNDSCFFIEFQNTYELISHGFHLSGLLFNQNMDLLAVRIKGGNGIDVLFNKRFYNGKKAIDTKSLNLIKYGNFYGRNKN